jgi:heterotetrameric sarcosine oxidase gamma subunit
VFETAWIVEGVERWQQDGWTSYGLGPQQWLVTHPEVRSDYEAQRDAVIAAGGALFDVSDARVAMQVGGEALSKGCGLDFDRFPVGECRATLLARIPVLIAREETDFVVFVPRSYAEWLRHWLNSGTEPELVRAPSRN